MRDFDLDTELTALKTQTQVIRKRRYSRSRLDRYKGELLQLYRAGASAAELQRWLRRQRVKVAWSTVYRWLQKHTQDHSPNAPASGESNRLTDASNG